MSEGDQDPFAVDALTDNDWGLVAALVMLGAAGTLMVHFGAADAGMVYLVLAGLVLVFIGANAYLRLWIANRVLPDQQFPPDMAPAPDELPATSEDD